MPPVNSADGLADALVAALLQLPYLEVRGVLQSVGAERLPPGWDSFSPSSKRRTLSKIIDRLPPRTVADLAQDFVGDGDSDSMALEPPAEQHTTSWPPSYAGPSDPAERYRLGRASATNSPDNRASQPTRAAAGVESAASIFVVHGRDTALESQTQLLVERTTGRTTVVLHEQVTGGRTVIEQIERHGASARYAIILLTGDDEGGLRGGEMRPRARQNVILELGYFWGRLGRDHVAVLVEDDVELPSDAGGIHYIAIDSGGGWKTKLVQELHDAGFDIDWSKLRA